LVNGSAARDRVADLLAPLFAGSGLDLEAVELIPAGRRTVLRIVIDADGGVSLDQLAESSTRAAKALDSTDVMGSRPYTLEVTSRGVDRPLTEPRHWRRNAGRLVKVVHFDGSQLEGRVLGADERGADLESDGHRHRIHYDAVAKAKVQVEFARFPGVDDGAAGGHGTDTAPDDEEG
jgi:ribosome maturation factor RimP